MKTCVARSTGILPVSRTAVPAVLIAGFRGFHGRDARGTHGRDAHATAQES